VGIWPSTLLHEELSSVVQEIRQKFEQNDPASTPYLVFEDTTASINQPLPLGITLKNGIGGETVVLNGMLEGTSLSAGSALTETRWSLPGSDLDRTFISAPKDFDGAMEVTVTLYSSRQDVLEKRRTRFSWSGSGKGDKLPTTVPSARSPAR
jgi:hypothetical protein